jgi:hypothetical protein
MLEVQFGNEDAYVYAARLYGYGSYYGASRVRDGSAAGWRAHRGLPTTPDAGACDCMLHATGARALGVSTGAAGWLSGRWGGERLVRCWAGLGTGIHAG